MRDPETFKLLLVLQFIDGDLKPLVVDSLHLTNKPVTTIQQICGNGTGTAGTVTFCLSGPEPECNTVPAPEPDLEPDPK